MCACYFRAQGEDFDVDAFLSESPWKNMAAVFRKGEAKSRGQGQREYSNLSIIVVEDENATVAQQVAECRNFIRDHSEELRRLQLHTGAKARWFSLAYYLPIGEVYAICPYFESEFLEELVGVGAEFEFNVFCTSVE
ncbi:hypothetical protein [Rubrivivax gelatinosus]|uniref:DUF4279 domain-containing protein n=1 Tax=Rubrivivax gelatinosus (strain NBRC 100245 / IL144) TaxID=983917 RepID=I0HNE3_RUBGI|nr:hypothetical protein [Rubrivivax gelatinosus]BAL94530.1 hypothetical protein RGE_11890 [Rubrivivax gelatinosus IL144]